MAAKVPESIGLNSSGGGWHHPGMMHFPSWSRCLVLGGFVLAGGRLLAQETVIPVAETGTAADFPLVNAGQAASVCADSNDFTVVQIAVTNFVADVARVTGLTPSSGPDRVAGDEAVLVGTLDHSRVIDGLVAAGKLDVAALRNQWESYVICTVTNPVPGVRRGLVIAGSDRRGTAYGLMALSEAIGVSPWYWWADVPPAHHGSLFVRAGIYRQGPPAVKYRGLFINDEDFGIKPWAANTYEPERKAIGPRTYARIFELLLRLRANYLWPAMHKCSVAFNDFPEDAVLADDYAIVMGSSHCEPMLRNNVGEWHHRSDEWNYQTHPDAVRAYWEERVRQNGRYENVYTLGMRGVHDDPLHATGSAQDKVQLVERIIADQRELLKRWVNPEPAQVPQIFIPYKEVLLIYRDGLKVPDDVTLMWVDDNHGYLRQLSSPAEQRRGGGSGVYYHVSYWGAPESYLWLCSTPPALIGEEMGKALDQKADRVWVLNVGDLKPAELDIDYFLRLARSGERVSQPDFFRTWAGRNFGPELAEDISDVLTRYYLLNGQVKPEHLTAVRFSFSPENDEAARRLADYQELVTRANAVYERLPESARAAYYELVLYGVRCSALANEKVLCAERSRRLAAVNDPAANGFARRAEAAQDGIAAETEYYNQSLVGGKWRRMMYAAPNHLALARPAQVGWVTNGVAGRAPAPAPQPTVPAGAAGFGELGGVVSMEAAHFTRNVAQNGVGWRVVPGLGRTGRAMTVGPTTIESITNLAEISARSPRLEFDFSTGTGGSAVLRTYCVPVHPVYRGRGARYAVGIDDEPPQVVDLETAEFSHEWATNVLRAAAVGETRHQVGPGRHTLKLWMVDAGVPVDKLVLDLGVAGQKEPSCFGPPETWSGLDKVIRSSSQKPVGPALGSGL